MQDLKFYIEKNEVKTLLSYSPDGWNDSFIHLNKSERYHGITQEITLPLNFVKDGAAILKEEFYTGNIETEIYLTIEKINGITLIYSEVYRGLFDFSTFKDMNEYVECSIIDKGIWSDIKSKEDINYTIPLTDLVDFDGVIIDDTVTASLSRNDEEIRKNITIINPVSSERFDCGIDLDSFDDNSGGRVSVRSSAFNSGTPFFTSNDMSKVSFTEVHSGTILFAYISGSPPVTEVEVTFQILKNDIVISSFTTNGFYISQFGSINLSDSNILNHEFIEGDDVRYVTLFNFTARESVGGAVLPSIPPYLMTIEYQFFDRGMSISAATQLPTVQLKAIRLYNLFDELIKKITDNKVEINFHPFLYDLNLYLLSGESVRGVDNPVIKVNLKDLYDSIDSKYFIGAGIIEDAGQLKLDIRLRDDFYTDVEISDLGKVSDLIIEPAKDLLISGFNIGSKNADVQSPLGRNEFNSEHTYTTPIKRISAKGSMVSPYRCDMYGIDELRVKYFDDIARRNEDDRSDDNIFILDCKLKGITPELVYELDRDDYLPANGGYILNVEFPETAYNMELSPKRSLLRWGKWFRSIMYNFSSDYLKFQSAKKNDLVKSYKVGESSVTENANVRIGSLEDALFLPFYFKFDVAPDFELYNEIKSNPRGYLTFEWKGNQYQGFLTNAEVKLAGRGVISYTLLATPNNNLDQLWQL